ncbi:MAG TPA: DinB family protein [Candidatus Limnocylindrales bacterium]|nr:DinB family protein [Candidatus Limnocylindrales bacterium]
MVSMVDAAALVWAFQDAHARFRAAVDGLDGAALTRTLGDETNSIAVLVTHALGNERWVLATLAGRPEPRDRAAEFAVRVESAAPLLEALAEADARAAELLPRIGQAALERAHAEVDGLSGRQWLLRCFGHMREHAAHAELTRQVLANRGR